MATKANMETSMGTIVLELFPADAPKTVENFVKLTNDGYYDGLIFHRVIPDFMIQGGCPQGTGTGGPGYTFEDEQNSHNVDRGKLAMANAGPNTNGSQFFIVTAEDCGWLKGKHTVFGNVVDGMDVIDAISAVERDGRDAPSEPITMTVTIVEDSHRASSSGSWSGSPRPRPAPRLPAGGAQHVAGNLLRRLRVALDHGVDRHCTPVVIGGLEQRQVLSQRGTAVSSVEPLAQHVRTADEFHHGRLAAAQRPTDVFDLGGTVQRTGHGDVVDARGVEVGPHGRKVPYEEVMDGATARSGRRGPGEPVEVDDGVRHPAHREDRLELVQRRSLARSDGSDQEDCPGHGVSLPPRSGDLAPTGTMP